MPRIAVATSDGETVHTGHFGDALYYHIYEHDGQKLRRVEVVENPYRDTEEHHHGDKEKRRALLKLLGNPDYIIATFYGPGGEEFFKKNSVTPIKVKPKTKIEDAVKQALTT